MEEWPDSKKSCYVAEQNASLSFAEKRRGSISSKEKHGLIRRIATVFIR